MNKRMHFYVSRKNTLTWLMAFCMVTSAASRVVLFGMKGAGASMNVWAQIVLPVVSTLLYAAIALFDGEEFFFKTAIPVWMFSAYSALWVMANVPSRLMIWLFWISLVFFSFLYTEITSGLRYRAIWLLLPVILSPLATILYCNREILLLRRWSQIALLVPDILVLLGCAVLVFAIRIHPMGEYHPSWGDRSDGRRIRTLPALNQVSPYIMVTRNTSMNFFEESFEISNIDRYIRQKRREGLTNFGITHVFLACYCRAVAKYPGINRFVSGQRIFSRGEDIQFCMTIKKGNDL